MLVVKNTNFFVTFRDRVKLNISMFNDYMVIIVKHVYYNH